MCGWVRVCVCVWLCAWVVCVCGVCVCVVACVCVGCVCVCVVCVCVGCVCVCVGGVCVCVWDLLFWMQEAGGSWKFSFPQDSELFKHVASLSLSSAHPCAAPRHS